MKHTIRITLILLAVFILAQLVGLAIVNEYIDVKESAATGVTTVRQETYEVVRVEPPKVENESTSFVFILIAVLIGTGLVLLIIKFGKKRLWKLWFFLAVLLCLLIAFSPFIHKFLKAFLPGVVSYTYYVTFAIALLFAFFKTFRQNVYVHNFTEIFIYGGLAAILVPIINIFSVVILLILISAYDVYAVWKSKHMVTMAKFQKSENLFAGLVIPYSSKEEKTTKKEKIVLPAPAKHLEVTETQEPHSAILGGGDIAFPLLFSGVVLKTTGLFTNSFIIVATTAIALAILLLIGKKDRFYPAMPFISAGCFVGYGIVWLIGLI